jgi:hypothetical protein
VLASGGKDGTVRLWDPANGSPLGDPLTGHGQGDYVLSVAWGRLEGRMAWGQLDGRPVLASGGSDGTVLLWDPADGRPLGYPLTGHRQGVGVISVAWGQLGDRQVLASGGGDSTVRLWDPAGGGPLGDPLAGHTDVVLSVAWGQLRNRPVLASGGKDGTVRLWYPVIERLAPLPGYRSDDPTDPDRLNRDAEAIALAEMITARSVRPPLAVGLFGDWGEGKSHFLGRLSHHVQELAARADPEDQLTFSGVRQVRFNAWHYAEADLWASLVSELFTQLLAGTHEPGEEERRHSRLAAELINRRHLPQRLDAAQQRQLALQQELHELQASEEETVLARLDPQQQARLAALAGDQPEQFFRESHAATIGVRAAARFIQQLLAAAVRSRWFWLALLLLIAATVVVLTAPGPVIRLVGIVGGAASLVLTGIKTVHDSMDQLREQARPWVDKIRKANTNRRQRLETAIEVATAQVSALQTELRRLTPTGELVTLVERRGGEDSPYRTRVGLMTQIREDFEEMARLLAAPPGPSSMDTDEVNDELPHIDRIVIYIDDLDRCPPARVVEVLEAVHLLLALPLFVVVVAVDPRWLLSSLTVHYRDVLDVPGQVSEARGDNWGSTPMQYLEKIFQIPFTLPPVEHTGYAQLVDALTVSKPSADRTTSPVAGDSGAADPASSAGAPSLSGGPTEGPLLPGVPVVERFDPLVLTDEERRLLTLFGPPLVTTPRSIKRLVNSYGLLNALRGEQHQQDLQEKADSSGHLYHPYRAAMTLLAILIAFPHLSPMLFTHLHKAGSGPDPCTWRQFLKQAEPQRDDERRGDEKWSSNLLGQLDAGEAARWQRLVDALEAVTEEAAAAGVPLPEALSAWIEWVLPVGRLSFETGRVVMTLQGRATKG